MGGLAVTQVFEGEKRFDLTVRWLEQYRSSLESIRELTISTPAGGHGAARANRQDPRSTRGRATSTARTGSVTRRSSSASAGATSRAPSPRRSSKIAAAGSPALRLAPRLGGRNQSAQGGRGPPEDDPPGHAPSHRLPRLQRGEELGRLAHRLLQHPGGDGGRRPGAPRHRDPLLGLGGDGLHLHLRHRGAGRHPGRDVLPAPAERGGAARSWRRRAKRPRSGSGPA